MSSKIYLSKIEGNKFLKFTVEERILDSENVVSQNILLDNKEFSDNYVYINDLEEAKKHMKVKFKFPSKLPKGYEFKNVSFYVENIEEASGEYSSLLFTNGEKEFFIMQVLGKEENKFITRASEIEEININGRKAVIDKKGNIDIEIDDVVLSLLTKGNISREEAIDVIGNIINIISKIIELQFLIVVLLFIFKIIYT